ncbi:ATP-binding protein [Streptomyces sp. NPDC091377]|uniref:ATP-binding protein n=1 Tax=unclassified Streptomyces TaxID=2593676 RepID=UPI003829322E
MGFDHRQAATGSPAGTGTPTEGALRFTAGPAVSGPAPVRVPAELEALDRVAEFVLDVGRRGGLTTGGLYRLRLAADELTTNTVVHGYRGAPGEILLEGGVEASTVWVRIEDGAPPFDPREGKRDPDLEAPLSERRIGGLGVYLACTSLDGYDYRLVAGRNVSTLEMHRPADSGTQRRQDARGTPATE